MWGWTYLGSMTEKFIEACVTADLEYIKRRVFVSIDLINDAAYEVCTRGGEKSADVLSLLYDHFELDSGDFGDLLYLVKVATENDNLSAENWLRETFNI